MRSIKNKQNKPTFGQIADEFIFYCQYERDIPVTQQTLVSYKAGIKRLNEYFSALTVSQIGNDQIINFKKSMIDRKCSSGYIQRILSLLRAILRFCSEERGMEVFDPAKIKLPPRIRKEVEYLTPDQLKEFMAGIDDKLMTVHGIRFKAILSTLLDTGMRISEVLSLNRDSINLKTKRAYIMGKGRKSGVVLFKDWSLYWISKYLELRTDPNPALFVNHAYNGENERLSSDHVRRHFQKNSKYTGVYASPHTIRRTAATWFKRNGADIRDVQLFLRHSKITTTELYVGKDYEALQESQIKFLNYGPLEDIGKEVSVVRVWSRKEDCCKQCSTQEKKHMAKGLCTTCYWRIFISKPTHNLKVLES